MYKNKDKRPQKSIDCRLTFGLYADLVEKTTRDSHSECCQFHTEYC